MLDSVEMSLRTALMVRSSTTYVSRSVVHVDRLSFFQVLIARCRNASCGSA